MTQLIKRHLGHALVGGAARAPRSGDIPVAVEDNVRSAKSPRVIAALAPPRQMRLRLRRSRWSATGMSPLLELIP